MANEKGRRPCVARLEPSRGSSASSSPRAGRIFADRHWLSDTMAGAALGVCIVSCVVGFVEKGRRSEGARTGARTVTEGLAV